MRTSFPLLFASGLVLSFTGNVLAQEWAKAMFNHTDHDFGTVARGAKVEHRFGFENIYLEDAHVVSVRSSCGCTVPEVTKPFLKTYEQSELIAKLDTKRFTGRRDATLTVVFDKPFPAEVQLHVYAFIRGDVVVQPGEARFESVEQGATAKQRLMVSYAGRNDWRILAVKTNRPCLEATVVERGRNQGQVTYELEVTLKPDTPVGYLRDQLVLVTDDRDPKAAQVPVPVEAIVVPGVQVRPNPLTLGVLSPGQSVTRQLVVQAKKPFRVLSAVGPDSRFQFTVPESSRPVQLIPVIFTADQTTGKIAGSIRLQTDLADQLALEVGVNGQVVAPAPPATGEVPAGESGALPPLESLPQPVNPASSAK
ncbi:MAG: DUF1573 domain-containing protein [Pirellulales bacterium]|nr:DUF1573 domain-containing protein [Pirellulales bacterium]